MKQRQHKVILGVVIAVVVLAVGFGVVRIVSSLTREDADTGVETEVTQEVPAESYGYVDTEKVATVVRKFNQIIIDRANWELLPVDEEMMVVHDEAYWFSLDDDLALVIVPVAFSGKIEEDEARVVLIYTDQDAVKREKALVYYPYLIQANDESLLEGEIAELMAEAENLHERGEMANRGKGIFVAINESEDHIEYQVVRNYPEGEN